MHKNAMLIYVVDDDHIFHLYMDMCLHFYRGSCLHFNNGAEFINYLESTRSTNASKKQILFTDIQMPVMDGLEVLQFLQKNGYESIHKNIISAENKNLIAPQLLVGIDNFFSKPVSPDLITSYLNERLVVEISPTS